MSVDRHDHDDHDDHHDGHAEVCWPCRPAGPDSHPGDASARKRLWIAIGVTAVTMVVEAVAGTLVGSLALVSDAGHMLTHAFALGVTLAALVLAARATSPERSFGHHRVEILAALLNGVVLLGVTAWIAWEAVERFRSPVRILDLEMLLVAVAGLAVNVATMALLHGARHRDMNLRSAFLHMAGDLVSSVGVVAGALAIRWTGRLWIDPALSIAICVLILVWSVGLIRDAVHVLLEAAPPGVSIAEIRESVRAGFPEVGDLRDVHVWSVASRMVVMTARVAVRTDSLEDCCALGERVEAHLRTRHGIGHVTLQFVREPK